MKFNFALSLVFQWIGTLVVILEVKGTIWTQWSEWSTCNVTCGGGFKIRTRSCQRNVGELYCDGSKIQKKVCNKVQCRKPVLSAASYWGVWSDWSMCSLKGSIIELRSRTCYVTLDDKVMPACLGDSFEIRSNAWPECSLTGSWSTWGEWSTPAVTCSNLQQINLTRSRTCLGKSNDGIVLVCSGISKENKKVTVPFCHQWTAWSEWMKHDTSEDGLCIRIRECLPSPGLCPGPYKEGTFCKPLKNKLPDFERSLYEDKLIKKQNDYPAENT